MVWTGKKYALESHLISGYADGGDAPTKQLHLVPGALEGAVAFLQHHAETERRFEKVSGLVEGFESPFGLELLATVHWIVKNETVRTVEDLISKIYAWNERKKQFTPCQINLALDVLTSKGWLDRLQ